MKKIFYLILAISFFTACRKESVNTQNEVSENGNIIDNIQRPEAVSRVTIGTQVWMTKNLSVSKYRNGDTIPKVTNATQWKNLTTGAWCYYANKSVNGTIAGKLYNWYAVNDTRGLAPLGWHIPSNTEWNTLATYLGGETIAGGKMKSTTMWDAPNFGATNSSGFTALAGGYRHQYGPYYYWGSYCYWWSADQVAGTSTAFYYTLFSGSEDIQYDGENKGKGFSVRCIKN